MRRFTYECEPCSVSFEITVGHGEETPEKVFCPQCREESSRRWEAPQFIVRGKEIEYSKAGAIPHVQALDPYKRTARKLESDHEKFLSAKAKFAKQQRRERGTARNESGMRYLGSIPMHEALALQRETGDKLIVSRDPLGCLKRTGREVK